MDRRAFKPSALDVAIIFAVLIISIIWLIYISLFMYTGSASGVIIESDGKIYAQYDFNSFLDTKLVEIESKNGYNIVELKNGQARISDTSCQDRLCTDTGWISKPNQITVCLPNKLVVRLVGKSDVDYISY